MQYQELMNKLMLLSDKEILKVLNEIYQYENVKITADMFLSATPSFVVNFKNPFNHQDEEWLEPLFLKQVIPDFMINNLTTFRREETKMMLDFLRVFLVRVFVLNFFFTVKKNQNLYLSPLKSYQYTASTANNRKNIQYFFKNFFQKKVQIIENIPERYTNFNQFKLGQTVLHSKYTENKSTIGNYVFTSLHKYNVLIDLDFDELEQLENCMIALNRPKILILRSNPGIKSTKRYYFTLSFVGNVLKSIYSYLPDGVSYA